MKPIYLFILRARIPLETKIFDFSPFQTDYPHTYVLNASNGREFALVFAVSYEHTRTD